MVLHAGSNLQLQPLLVLTTLANLCCSNAAMQ
jgi:hypothetical protein